MNPGAKKVLYVTYALPYPLNYGYPIRAFNIAKILASRYKVDLLSINPGSLKPREISRGLASGNSVFNKVIVFKKRPSQFVFNAFKGIFKKEPLQVAYYYFKDIQEWINSHYKEYDLIVCSTIRTAKYVKNLPVNPYDQSIGVGARKVIDFIDAVSLYYQEAKKLRRNFFWKLIYGLENKRLLPYERKVLNDFDLGIITSEFDKNYIGSVRNQVSNGNLVSTKLQVIPNGVEIPTSEVKQYCLTSEVKHLVFLGKMDYAPNEDAVLWFSKEIFPELKKKFKDLKFLIVGKNPTKKVKRLSNILGIEITGFVKDPSFYLKQAKVIVVPLRFGAGIQNKILEAMALGKTVITTPVGARGIEAKDGIHFLVAQNKKDLMEKISSVYNNPEKRNIIGQNARKLIEEKYNWIKISQNLLAKIIIHT